MGILRSSHTRRSRKSAQPRSKNYGRPWLRSAVCDRGYYRDFLDFLIIPTGCALSHGRSWPIGAGMASCAHLSYSEFSKGSGRQLGIHQEFIASNYTVPVKVTSLGELEKGTRHGLHTCRMSTDPGGPQ
jgi:hypothetical protein